VLFPEVSAASRRAYVCVCVCVWVGGGGLPSSFPAAGNDGDTSKSVFVQPLHKYPLCRLRLAEETPLDWGPGP